MINISIAEKDFKAVCHRKTGREISGDIVLYNEIFGTHIHEKKDMVFLVYDSRKQNEVEKKNAEFLV